MNKILFIFLFAVCFNTYAENLQNSNTAVDQIKETDINFYGGFELKKKFIVQKKTGADYINDSTFSIDAKSFVGMKSQVNVDWMENMLESDIKFGVSILDFVKSVDMRVNIYKAFVKVGGGIGQLKIGYDETNFGNEDFEVGQINWISEFNHGFKNILALETSSVRHIFYKSDGYLKSQFFSDKTWTAFAIVEKLEYKNDQLETTIDLIYKPIIYQKANDDKNNVHSMKSKHGYGVSMNFKWNIIQDWTKLAIGVTFGSGIGHYIGSKTKSIEESFLPEFRNGIKLAFDDGDIKLCTGLMSYIKLTQFFVPKRLSLEFKYSYETAGLDFAGITKPKTEKNTNLQKDDVQGWDKFNTISAKIVWDISQVEKRFRYSFGIKGRFNKKNPIDLTSDISMSLV